MSGLRIVLNFFFIISTCSVFVFDSFVCSGDVLGSPFALSAHSFLAVFLSFCLVYLCVCVSLHLPLCLPSFPPSYRPCYVQQVGLSDVAASLPIPELGNLEEIRDKLKAGSHVNRDIMAASITRKGFVHKLYQIFATAEDLEQEASLVHLFEVRRSRCGMCSPRVWQGRLMRVFVIVREDWCLVPDLFGHGAAQ